ncbi:protein ref(2)P [Drosophila montana]|uniref:protein ref(2)P n=1 Tax=Drosophila montana TaxID=40370 RepID=UPI00313BA396
MPERLLKITYHDAPASATKKLNAYLRMPSNTFAVLRREIEMYLFQERELPVCNFRTYWIDSDSDEIEVINQNDYEIFLAKCEKNMHLQIAACRIEQADAKQAPASGPAEDDPTNFIIHEGIECDSCKALPLVGFRYKCMQCPNFDLCQACESAHKHPEHLMARMPTNNGPRLVDAWITGPGGSTRIHRRTSRRCRDDPTMMNPWAWAMPPADSMSAKAAPTGATAPNSPKESRRERRHARRHGGVFSNIMEMMMNLPEGNVVPTMGATPAAAATPPEANDKKETALPREEPTVATAMKEGAQNAEKSTESNEIPIKASVEPETANVEEPVAAPRSPKEQPKAQEIPAGSSTPTTPVINLESFAQIVNPEYMRAGIEILNNFSEIFARMIDPSEAAAFGCADTSMASRGSTASEKSEVGAETAQNPSKQATPPTSAAESPDRRESQTLASEPTVPKATAASAAPEPQAVPDPKPTTNAEAEARRSSESLDQDWQMIDNSASPMANVSNSDALINLTSTNAVPTNASVSPARDFVQLGEMLRQHVNEEQQREQTTAHTQTSQVNTVSTSTSTTGVSTNSTSTSTAGNPPAPEEKRQVPIYHTDERINAAVHAMMAMGFSNEGAWLTQLLESVEGNIPAALDIMHTSQSGRN